MKGNTVLYYFLLILILSGCSNEEETLFILRDDLSHVDFINQLSYTEDFNPYTYRNFYNGGGVALGDINNDGLIDIYLTGNIVDNKLYLNKGDWQFEDITLDAGVSCEEVWSTGATFVDINGDGLQDLYVCKSGKPGGENRHNELFINQGDLTFKEMSREYNLDITGLSVHSAFFDYDRDGDLDCYVLNNSIRSVGGFDLVKDQRNIPDPEGNRFLENRDGQFMDITESAGIYSSKIGYGLGITLSDFNRDGWTDIFVSNDFFERDYLYINQQDGTFLESAEDYFDALSMGSMGADAADLNNDEEIDLFVTEMLPATLERKKTKATYESWDKYSLAIEKGYYHQYPRNVLQRSFGNDGFLEIGRFAGVESSEWSWASLITDLNNDGLKDIFVSNGIHKDLLDRDYLAYMANEDIIRNMIDAGEEVIMNLIDMMPSKPIPNKCYKNIGNFNFEEVGAQWGFDQPTFSNGSAYGDLDNDGDLDLVVNNVNMPAYFYQNMTDTSINRSLTISLTGKEKNTKAIGAKIILHLKDGSRIVGENYVSRGFQSSTSDVQVIGLGQQEIDGIQIIWPDGVKSFHSDVQANRSYNFSWPEIAQDIVERDRDKNEINLEKVQSPIFKHFENNFSEFNRDRLLVKMTHNNGPGMAVGDVNNDGKEDVFIGGAKNQESEMWLSNRSGFDIVRSPFDQHSRSEVIEAQFFDSDGDGDLDLYVAHGGRAFSVYSRELDDQLYINDGRGNFETTNITFDKAISTGTISIFDMNADGRDDIFIGERYKDLFYGLAGSGFLLINQGDNNFELQSNDLLQDVGMITSSSHVDLNGDGVDELIIAGEWMGIKIYSFHEGQISSTTDLYLNMETEGMWQEIHAVDIDKDGDMDLVCGNIGENNFLKEKARLYIGDFDQNGRPEQIIALENDGKYFPIHDMDEMIAQMPGMRKNVLYYKDYATSDLSALIGPERLEEGSKFQLAMRQSVLLVNNAGDLEVKTLPAEVQYSSVYGIASGDFNNDGAEDLVLGGNQYLAKPQFGRDDASHGWVLFGENDDTYEDNPVQKLNIRGQIRQIETLNGDRLIFAMNNDTTQIYKIIF